MGARYHPGVIWGPFLLALALGLVVSAGLYFAYLWPQVEPDDEEDGERQEAASGSEKPASGAKKSADGGEPAGESPGA